MSIPTDELELELTKIEEKGLRKLEEQVQSAMKLHENLYSFLDLWKNAIGQENIAKILYRRKK